MDNLKLTGRESAQVKLVEDYAKKMGLWADEMVDAVYERVLEFNLSSAVSYTHLTLPTILLV